MTLTEAHARVAQIRAERGIPPGGFVEGHLIPAEVREAMQRG
jgi:hypothetical protein